MPATMPASMPASPSVDETAVRDLVLATGSAWAANDAGAFTDLYASDATVVLPGGVYLRGQDEIRAFMTAGFADPLKGTTCTNDDVTCRAVGGAGDTAVVISVSAVLQPGEETVPVARQRRATWTVSRHGGSWLVDAYTNSPVELAG